MKDLPWEVWRSSPLELMSVHRYAEDAAAMVALLGDGATVCVSPNHAVVWEQGKDGDAGESYDGAAAVMSSRARYARVHDYGQRKATL